MRIKNIFKIMILIVERNKYQAGHGGLESHYNNTKEMRTFAWNEIDSINKKIEELKK